MVGVIHDIPAWRMTANSLHTPLEELLFFNSLRSAGIDASTFARISEQLKENTFIRSGETYDSERLSSANLQKLFFRVLKDEAGQNDRRRKLSSPPLQSIDEAAKHKHLIPQLVDRLYARYRDSAVEAIRREERRYDELKQDPKPQTPARALPPINTSVSSTKWKQSGKPTGNQRSPVPPPRSPYLPSSPELSPVEKQETPRRDARARRGRGGARGRGRAGSSASGRGRTRSRSVQSKKESTPQPDEVSTPRRGPKPQPERMREIKRGTKRKRAGTVDSRPNQIFASRHFPRIVAPVMLDINSHKLASMFAKPITEREAPGYHGIIYKPQDLKTIRASISHGSRAVVAKIESEESVASPITPSSKAAQSVWLERAPDIVPPKGIVNSAQFEKEICRMFANAVMFNLDPQRGFSALLTGDSEDESDEEGHYEVDDGGAFVRDAREMFAGVEKSVNSWRSAERVDTEKKEETEDDVATEEETGRRRGRSRAVPAE